MNRVARMKPIVQAIFPALDLPQERFVTDYDYQRLALRLRDLNSEGCRRKKSPIIVGRSRSRKVHDQEGTYHVRYQSHGVYIETASLTPQ